MVQKKKEPLLSVLQSLKTLEQSGRVVPAQTLITAPPAGAMMRFHLSSLKDLLPQKESKNRGKEARQRFSDSGLWKDCEAPLEEFWKHSTGILTMCKLITQGHSINVTTTLNLLEKASEGRGHLHFSTAVVSLPLCCFLAFLQSQQVNHDFFKC